MKQPVSAAINFFGGQIKMTGYEKMYGIAFVPAWRQVHAETVRVLKTFDRDVGCDELLEAICKFFGCSNTVHDAAIQAWIDFYAAQSTKHLTN